MVDAAANGFVETEIGLLPSDWMICKLGECCTLGTGGTPSRAVAEYWNGDIPWVKTGEITYTTILETEESISQQGLENSAAKIYPAGTLLVAMYGQGVTRGRAGILGIDAAINQACAAISVTEQIRSDFLFYALKAHYERIRELGHGANQRNLNMQLLRGVEIPVPPIDEQRAIASVLRTVQQAKEATEKVITAARQLKLSLMQHLFTYGPVPFQDAEHVELQSTEVGNSPAHWRICRFSEVVEPVSGQVDPKVSPYAEMIHVGPENIEEGTGRLTASLTAREVGLTSGKYLFDESHVLYSKIRPYLKKVCLPHGVGICSADMYPLIPSAVLSRDFLYAWLLSNQFTTQAVSYQSRTGIPKINRTQLGSTFIPVPPLEEQELVAKCVIDTDAKLNVELIRHNALSLTFDSLLHELMTGQRRVHELELEFTEEEAV